MTNAAKHILDALTPDAVARLGFSERNLRAIRTHGLFPGAWFGPVEAECLALGIPCDRAAFRWKSKVAAASPTPNPELSHDPASPDAA